ncbi:hypothetical protein F0562_029056 [Nyssa sinensis]|uniref:DUF674 domain-containing protein n=1 Tax=Nyssa sinensis TaxID=561372 RepID=A0A5J5B1U3_9ASTE|nr:hypothetical protein F0562_029056 [Nyssa sinensis]
MANEASQSITLKVLVEQENSRVVFVEATKDFVDILFSFMTMPIGTIIRLTREHLSEGEMSCLKNLYESVEKLDEEYVNSVKCKEDMLLDPQSAAEIYCRNLKLNLFDGNSNEYYACSDRNCGFVSSYQTVHCRCGKIIDLVVKLSNPISVPQDRGGVFVKPTTRFMITDDFQVMPLSTMTGLALLRKLVALNGSKTEEKTVNIGRDEVLKLLQCSLTSKKPFTETIMKPPLKLASLQKIIYGQRSMDQSQMVKDTTRKDMAKINLKLIVQKSCNKALYAEANEDFVDLIAHFLTFPLGYIFKEFPYLSSSGCMGNLYKSIKDVDANKYFKSEEMRAILVNPKLASGLAYSKQIIPIEEAPCPSHSALSSLSTVKHSPLRSKSNPTGYGFAKGPNMFMVTDNLIIKPLSPILGISLINILNIPLSDIGERKVTMNEDQALHLLAATLVSNSALTDVFIRKKEAK